ncbi:MAG: macro domain-containing protein [Anaerolineales bacterium]|nr:macro domain-containing protein [Anaerolineales bacterium]MCX7755160.1 macro domain-containing protein [Anaerolineales bacterium]MDW8277826.1 macro domain-containing protein [Anaerolineales bacterium]
MSEILREKAFSNGRIFQITQGDITLEPLDAIVNAANAYLQHGGGVAWAIWRRGGEAIQRESDEWVRKYGPVTHEKPAYTSGGLMPCKYVIHAVGPVWGAGDEDQKLAATVRGALERASELGLRSLALPAISTGIFGFPKERAADILFAEIERYLSEQIASSLELVRLVLFDTPTIEAFLSVWDAQGRSSLPAGGGQET